MKKQLLISTMLLSLVCAPAFAQENLTPPPGTVASPETPTGVTAPVATAPAVTAPSSSAQTSAPVAGHTHHDVTLDQARARAHKHAEKLDKMTPEQYAAEKEKRRERREKWQHMSLEERAAAKKAAHEKWAASHHKGAAPAAAPAAPASGGQ